MAESQTARVEAFSDGVFAVAITLLVLDLKAPAEHLIGPGTKLWRLLLDEWPGFLAFITSFVVILIIWLNHHMTMKYIIVNDGKFMLLNGLLLLFISLLPFSTSLLAEHIGHEGAKDAIIFYCGTMLALSFAFQISWRYATANGRLLSKEHNRKEISRIHRQFNTGAVFYIAAFIVAFFYPYIALGMIIFLAGYFLTVGIFKQKD